MDDNVRIVALAKPIRKGLLRLVFSRFFVFAILLVMQVALMIMAYMQFTEKLPAILKIEGIFTFVMIIYLFNSSMDSSAKLTWMLIISLVPLTGAFLLLFTQSNFGHRSETRMVRKQIERTHTILTQPENVRKEVEHDGSGTDDLSRYLNRTGCFPLYDKTQVTYFTLGEHKFEAMLRELEKAEKYIFMEYFIIEEGYMWGRILDTLIRKAAEGVEVRALYDGFGNCSNDRPLKQHHLDSLHRRGIQIKEFDRLAFPFFQNSFFRDHRKVVVIDGLIAYTGGMNVADYYIVGKPEFGEWRDLHCRIEGDAVAELQKVFMDFWNDVVDDNLQGTQYYPGERRAQDYFTGLKVDTTSSAGSKVIGVVNRIPRQSARIMEQTFIEILDNAQCRVQLINPYFTLTPKVVRAFKRALKRGVKMEIMVSAACDIPVTPNVTEYYCNEFAKLGADIYVFHGGFHHSKVMMVDDSFLFLGSANLNGRSLKMDYECNVLIADPAATQAMQTIFEQDKAEQCTLMTPADYRKKPVGRRFWNWLLHISSPLL
jgi:cardiolipin synthase